jgi:transposase
MDRVEQGWVGIDAGKGHHHVVLIDGNGRPLLSRRAVNDELELAALIDVIRDRVTDLTWAIDLADGAAALMIALLLHRDQRVFYLPGIAVSRASAGYRGEGKTDARDAAIIADQARMRRDLRQLRLLDGDIVRLRLLTAYRADLAADRTRSINRLRGLLVGIFPALERVLDFTNQGPLILIGGFQTPTAIRRLGQARLARWLEKRRVRGAARLAAAAAEAAGRQTVEISGEAAAASVIARLAQTILELDRQLAVIDREAAAIFHTQADAAIITSLTGIGDVLGAELLAAIGGSLAGFISADHLAGYAGLAPTPRDSGYRTGNLHRPQRYNRQLQRVFYTSAMISIQRSPASKAFYDGKRAQGKRHTQAVIALARRRVNVLRAMLRDHQPYQERQQKPALAA